MFEPPGPSSAATGVEASGECSCAALAEPLTLAELVVDVEIGICTSNLLAINRCGRSSGLLRVAMGRFCLALSFGRRSGRPQSPQALDQLSLFACSILYAARRKPGRYSQSPNKEGVPFTSRIRPGELVQFAPRSPWNPTAIQLEFRTPQEVRDRMRANHGRSHKSGV